jgi:ATP-binding protein involved in chromosome partitioning
MSIRETSDSGLPIVATQPDSASAASYRAIAAKVRDQLGTAGPARSAPKIVIEA